MKKLLFSLMLVHAAAAQAQLDEHQKKGLEDTQDLLRSKSKREAAIKGDKKAEDADAKLGALAGSEQNKEGMYDLASQVMEKITIDAKGDPQKMQKLLLEAQANPQAFYNKYFSAEQKEKVRGIANDIEKKKKPMPGAH